MIQLKEKSDCCGCLACVQICPNHCISLNTDEQGFVYPKIDTSQCINCNLCESVCPVLNQGSTRFPLKVYAAKNLDDNIRNDSSSGGVFTSLAIKILNDGGVVFGARFSNSWSVIHDYTESIDELYLFRGAKYSQSFIGDSYKQVLSFLKQGRLVLFTGTPCQICALKKFLRKDYLNLYCVDVVCHGVPSPLVWSQYLKSICGTSLNLVKNISFRNKDFGWSKYSLKIDYLNSSKYNIETNSFQELACTNDFLQGFVKNLYLRPSCTNCPAKAGKSDSDLTIADYWGIADILPKFVDECGVSLVLIYTSRGYDLFKSLHLSLVETSYEDALKSNPSIIDSSKFNKYYKFFWKKFRNNGVAAIPLTIKKLRPNFFLRFAVRIKHFINKIFI